MDTNRKGWDLLDTRPSSQGPITVKYILVEVVFKYIVSCSELPPMRARHG